jgi:hypothetical protein
MLRNSIFNKRPRSTGKDFPFDGKSFPVAWETFPIERNNSQGMLLLAEDADGKLVFVKTCIRLLNFCCGYYDIFHCHYFKKLFSE